MSENENQDESSVIKQLRKELKERDDRLAKLEPIARQSAFKEAGVDVSSGPGKFFAEKYDGELTPEAIKEAAEPYGFLASEEQQQAPAQQEDSTQQRVSDLRQSSTPDGSAKRYSFSEFQQLSKVDPPAAKAAHAAGLVDFPPHMAPDLAASSG